MPFFRAKLKLAEISALGEAPNCCIDGLKMVFRVGKGYLYNCRVGVWHT